MVKAIREERDRLAAMRLAGGGSETPQRKLTQRMARNRAYKFAKKFAGPAFPMEVDEV